MPNSEGQVQPTALLWKLWGFYFKWLEHTVKYEVLLYLAGLGQISIWQSYQGDIHYPTIQARVK